MQMMMMMMMFSPTRMAPVVMLWLALCLSGTWAVDRGNFKTCDQSAFCKWVNLRRSLHFLHDAFVEYQQSYRCC